LFNWGESPAFRQGILQMKRGRAIVIPTKQEAASILSMCQNLELLPWDGAGRCYQGELVGTSIHIVICGMGIDRASAATRQLIKRHQPEDVVHLGLAGALREDLPIGTLLYAERVELAGDGPSLACSLNLWDQNVDKMDGKTIKGCTVTSDKVIDCLTDRQSLQSKYQADIVDMESYGVVTLCQKFSIPVSVFRVVSDAADEQCQDDFWRGLKPLAKQLSKVAANICRSKSLE
jgi:nucleoside phosphorylase